MRRILLASMALAACATSRAASLPDNPGWIGGQHVVVSGPESVGVGGPELAAGDIRGIVESDLILAGFAVVDDPAAMQVELTDFSRSKLVATVRKGGREVERSAGHGQ